MRPRGALHEVLPVDALSKERRMCGVPEELLDAHPRNHLRGVNPRDGVLLHEEA